MTDRFIAVESRANQNWTTAVHLYRAALDTYRRSLEARALGGSVRARAVAASQPLRITPAPTVTMCDLEELTPREREVAALIAQGYSNQQIAESLVLTRGTVANHVAHILFKTGATNRTQVAALVLENKSRPPAARDSPAN